MKTTKYTIFKEIKSALDKNDDRLADELAYEVVYLESDVEQLQKELIKEGILFGLSESSCKNNPDLLISRKKFDDVFNNFKGK